MPTRYARTSAGSSSAGRRSASAPGRSIAAETFAVCEWTAQAVRDDGQRLEWDGVDVFPLRDGKILRKDVYSTSHTPRLLGTAG